MSVDWQRQRHTFAYQREADLIAQMYPKKDAVVLDIGCGDGYGTKILSHVSTRVTGFDNDSSVLPSTSEFILWDATKDKVPEETDVIIANQFIEHLEAPKSFIKNVMESLNDGGTFMLTTPNRDFRLAFDERAWNKEHYEEYSSESLRSMIPVESVYICGIFGTEDIMKWEVLRRVRISIKAHDPVNLCSGTVLDNLADRVVSLVTSFVDRHNPQKGSFRIAVIEDTNRPLDLFATITKVV